MTRSAFITGGTGFVGRHIVEQLTHKGWRVVALHRRASDLTALRRYPVELVEGSITDAKSIDRAMPPSCDAVFHVAANMSLWSGGDEQQTRDNVIGTRIIARAALAKEARRFVYTSTVSAWGAQEQTPFDETATSNALSSSINYEKSKYMGELEIDEAIARGLKAVILNPGNIVGRYDVRGWARLIRLVHARKLPGVPPGAASWAHAVQVARAHVAAADHGRVGERYLLGGTDATYLEVVRIIGELTSRPVPTRPTPAWAIRAMGRISQWGSAMTRRPPGVSPEIAEAVLRGPRLFSSQKAMRELGYRAVPLFDMLREAYDWLKTEGLLVETA